MKLPKNWITIEKLNEQGKNFGKLLCSDFKCKKESYYIKTNKNWYSPYCKEHGQEKIKSEN